MIYLASPYSHADATIRQARADAVGRATARLITLGYPAYSPIAHGHAIAPHLPAAVLESPAFWLPHCRAILARADAMLILTLPGHEISHGIAYECQVAGNLGLPITELNPGNLWLPDKKTIAIINNLLPTNLGVPYPCPQPSCV